MSNLVELERKFPDTPRHEERGEQEEEDKTVCKENVSGN
jgi:hypothetical protein